MKLMGQNKEFERIGRASRMTRGSSQRQALKGETLRKRALQSAIECLAEMPYSEVSTSLIAERAGISRGGMQYYFPTRLDLLRSVVSYLHAQRLEIFRKDLLSIRGHSDLIGAMIDLHWEHLNEREFVAYQELVLAARSEPELAEMLASSYRGFLAEWQNIARELIGWHAEDPIAARAGNVAHYLLEGMAYGRLGGQLRDEEVDEIKEFAKQTMRAANHHTEDDGMGFPL
jgi:AcrR family transcriptional regulator